MEKRAVRESAELRGTREVYLIESPSPRPSGPDCRFTEPICDMVVDIGGGTTEVAVISLAGIVYSKSVRVGGDKMDESILRYIKRAYNLAIGERTAEVIKTTISNAYPARSSSIDVKGRDLATGIPKIISINSDEIGAPSGADRHHCLHRKNRPGTDSPELAADIVDRGIYLTGGGALMKHLDVLLHQETGLPIKITEDPLSTVVLGSGKALDNLDILRGVALD